MSALKVTMERLVVEAHPGADRLELAQVGLYRAVVGKGDFKTGDYAIYIPEQAILPGDLIEELNLTGKLAGKDKNRVKAVRLRGALSQGVVCRPKAAWRGSWDDVGEDGAASAVRLACATQLDFAEALGITKWVPEIPTHMSGAVSPAPDLIRWVDIENLKRYPDVFTPGEPVVATEKIHGTCCLVTYVVETDTLLVSSKGFGEKNLALEYDKNNLYWRAVTQYGVKDQLAGIASEYDATSIALFGEVYGQGIQDLAYGKAASRNETLGFVAFDLVMVTGQGKWWANADHFRNLMDTIPTAPVLYEGPFDLEKLTTAASGRTVLGNGTNIREGIVIRPQTEQHSDTLGGRKIAKLVSEEYLLRKGATEFE